MVGIDWQKNISISSDDVLIVVDLQNDYFQGGKWELEDTEAAAKKRQHEEKIIQARIKEITSRRA